MKNDPAQTQPDQGKPMVVPGNLPNGIDQPTQDLNQIEFSICTLSILDAKVRAVDDATCAGQDQETEVFSLAAFSRPTTDNGVSKVETTPVPFDLPHTNMAIGISGRSEIGISHTPTAVPSTGCTTMLFLH